MLKLQRRCQHKSTVEQNVPREVEQFQVFKMLYFIVETECSQVILNSKAG